jgi:hypothetical protein
MTDVPRSSQPHPLIIYFTIDMKIAENGNTPLPPWVEE